MSTVAVITPHIPTREFELTRAVASVAAQTVQPDFHIIATDRGHWGSARVRNRALFAADTTWVAFLDDDDEFLANHLEVSLQAADESGADVIYAGCVVVDHEGNDVPIREEWGRFDQKFDPEILRMKAYLPVTSLVRTGLAKLALFGPPDHQPNSLYDDWGFYLRLLDLGAVFTHVPEVTWVWHHHGKNTSGQASRW